MRVASLLAVLALAPTAAAQQPEPKYEGKPLAYWVERFQKSENEKDRSAAEEAVVAFGPDAAPAVPTLLVMLDDRSRPYREQVANMLCAVGPAAKGAVPDLIKLLEEKSPRDPHQVIRILCAIGPDAKAAIPAIRRVVLEDVTAKPGPGRAVNLYYGYDFHRLGPAAVPMLLDLVMARCPDSPGLHPAARTGFESLRVLGDDGKAAAPRLAQLLGHDELAYRVEAARALWAVAKDPVVIPVLVAIVKRVDGGEAVSAAEALGEIGPAAADALHELKAILRRPTYRPFETQVFIDAEGKMHGGPPPGAVPQNLHDAVREAIQKVERKPDR